MPIYDYICSACRHRLEVIHGIHDPGPQFCPSCGAPGTMRKAMVTAAVHFKGSGWAKKDRSSMSGTRARSGSSSSSSGEPDASSSAKDGAANGSAAATTKSSDTTTTPGDAPKPSPSTEA